MTLSALRFTAGPPAQHVATGWPSIDAAFAPAGLAPAGLVRGGVHEWYGVSDRDDQASCDQGGHDQSRGLKSGRRAGHDLGWSPPLFLLTHLAAQAVLDADERGAPAHVVWVGQSIWPYPRALERCLPVIESATATLTLGDAPDPGKPGASARLLQRSLFVRSRSPKNDQADRLWSIDLALRCRGVTAVVADGSRLTMAATRRLQLAAAAANALVLLARPPSEIRELSAATTRWNVERIPSIVPPCPHSSSNPLWGVTLLRAKGAQKSHVAICPSEAAGRRRNQPQKPSPLANLRRHTHAARPCPSPSFPFDRPIPAQTPEGHAHGEPPWRRPDPDVMPPSHADDERTHLDRRTLQ